MANYEQVQMAVRFPQGMNDQEALRRAKALVPCETTTWELECSLEKSKQTVVVGLLYCEEGYYEAHPDGAEYGPDAAGVSVEWETP